jgi:hypothetical protein
MTSLRLIFSPSCISLRPDGHLHGLTQHVPVILSKHIIAKHVYIYIFMHSIGSPFGIKAVDQLQVKICVFLGLY